jgi:hypothetical protein
MEIYLLLRANVRHAWLYECDAETLKLSSEGGDCGSKKYERGYGSAYGGVWRILRVAGVWSQAGGFVLVRLAGIWFLWPWRCFHI